MAGYLDGCCVVKRRPELIAVAMLVVPMLQITGTPTLDAQEPALVFRGGVDLVRVSAIVQDRRGRLVKGLTADDFEIFDDGDPRPAEDVREERGGVSVALLFDVSGSMEGRLDEAREAATHVLGSLDLEDDEAAVFSFDTRLDEITPFTDRLQRLPASLETLTPFGATSLHDAIASTAERLEARPERRSAVVVFTDGNDNSSRLTPSEVSGIASAIDVPVYIFGIVPGIDNPKADAAATSARRGVVWDALGSLAHWTGGRMFVVSTIAERRRAALEVIEELRYQYLIAFEAGERPGWHPLVVRTRDRNQSVRARSGYFVGQLSPNSH
jgi:Ca-activated chloride channel family protein